MVFRSQSGVGKTKDKVDKNMAFLRRLAMDGDTLHFRGWDCTGRIWIHWSFYCGAMGCTANDTTML